jgi:L-threonylcarbamoyladenylate synthase
MPKRWDVTVGLAWDAALADIVAMLDGGGVVAYPTDTLYGLAVHPWRLAAVRRLFAIKGRDAAQAIPLVAADLAQVEATLGPLPVTAARLAQAFWPGPLTLVVPAPSSLPPELLGGGRTVAVRVPAQPLACDIARRLGAPVTATSANESGGPATNDPRVVLRTLGDRIDGLVDAGPSPGGLPSTVVEAIDAMPRLLRAGAVPWERVVQFLA